MRKYYNLLLVILLLLSCTRKSVIQTTIDPNQTVFKNGEYTLHFDNNDPGFSNDTKKKLVETFFIVYPKMVKEFNPASAKTIYFVVDTAYNGVAATSGARVVYNPVWFKKNPNDIDVVTHEVMHIVQNYGYTNGPWWITEGIADYVRYKYGIANIAGGWSLTPFNNQQRYDNGYRISARFLLWLEENVKKGIVKNLDDIMRKNTYTPQIWKKLTGKTLDELWQQYSNNPTI